MPTCKFKISKGRYSRSCEVPTDNALVFTTALDEGYLVTTQQPLCVEHLPERKSTLDAMRVTYHMVKLV